MQREINSIGRLDRLNQKGDIETLVRSLARYPEKVLLVLSGKSESSVETKKIAPALIFERLRKELGLSKISGQVLEGRLFCFGGDRPIFLTVLHRLMVSGSDRFCDQWRRDYRIEGVDRLSLHHLYRAIASLERRLRTRPGSLSD